MTTRHVKIENADTVMTNLTRFTNGILKDHALRGLEEWAKDELLQTQGVQRYPPSGPGNQPPTPYYVRGRGTQYARGNRGNSERYGTQFYVRSESDGVTVGNRASYAKWLTDEKMQARRMAKIGWRKLADVAKEKRRRLGEIMVGWIARAVKQADL